MSEKICLKKLYLDPTIKGECLLKPFKYSTQCFGFTFSKWSDKENSLGEKTIGVLKRIGFFVLGIFGTIFTTPLIAIGMTMKLVTRPKSTTDSKQQENNEFPLSQKLTSASLVTNYPGDLPSHEQAAIKRIWLDSNSIKLEILDPSWSITIRNEDIFKSQAQVIINAANTHLGGGGGIDGQIHTKGGEPYAEAHKALKSKYNGHYVEGYAEFITSGNLLTDYQIENVIVVAGPSGAATPEKEDQLFSCYFNSLLLADLNGKTSIAFPSISTGIFGFPKDRAAQISIRAIRYFIAIFPASQLKTISIHFQSQEDLKTYDSAGK